jgi:hypothetical protein
MIADFVNHRGGGLLMLGSHRSFVEGGYAGTPVAEVLPVVLDQLGDGPEDASAERSADPSRSRRGGFYQEVSVQPTRAGATHPSTLIADTEAASLERWKTVPPVTVVNPITRSSPAPPRC